MIANARHRVGNRHRLQCRTFKKCDIADSRDTRSPIDRLQRRAVVEQGVVGSVVESRAAIRVAVAAVGVVRVRNPRQRLNRVAERHRRQLRAAGKHSLLKLCRKFVLVRRNRYCRQCLVASGKAAVAQILNRIGKSEILEVDAVLKRLLVNVIHLRAKRHLGKVWKCTKRHPPYLRYAVAYFHRLKTGTAQERMTTNHRYRVRYCHGFQCRTIQKRYVADALDAIAPVNRLQRRAVVEQAVVGSVIESRAAIRVTVAAVGVVRVRNPRQLFHRVAECHHLQLRASREYPLL